MIKNLSFEQAAVIYNEYLIRHFPANEVKPLANIEDMWKKDGYFVYGFVDESDALLGYAFFSNCPGSKVVLLDYLAILDNNRGQGLGSRFLEELVNTLSDKDVIIIETEDVELAGNEEELLERQRRDAFYINNNVVKTGLVSKIYTANYRIWYLACNDKVKRDGLSDEQCKVYYDDIYQFMLSEKGYREFYEVHKA